MKIISIDQPVKIHTSCSSILLMIFSMIRHHQARSAMLLQSKLKSTGNFDIFKTYQSTQEPNQSSQTLVYQQVFICITADGCAFYTIPLPTQPPFLIFLFKWTFLNQNHNFSYIFRPNLF